MALAEVTPQPAPVGPDDATLVAAARSGGRWAAEALFRRHAARANRLAFRLLGRDADVDDVVQDAFVQSLQTLDRLKEPAAFGSWLCSMIVGRTAKLIRRRRMLQRFGLRSSTDPIAFDELIGRSCPADVAVELRAIYTLLDRMDSDVRIALILRRVEGATIEEAADMMGTSPATVKRKLSRAEEIIQNHRGREES